MPPRWPTTRRDVLDVKLAGCDHMWTLILRMWYGKLLCRKADASAIDILEDTVRRSNRVLGPNHPDSEQMQDALDDARAKLALDSS